MEIKGVHRDCTIEIDPGAVVDNGVEITMNGSGHYLKVYCGAVLRRMTITFNGKGNSLVINEGCKLRGAMYLRQENSSIEVGRDTTFVSARLFAMEGRSIFLGADCMLSTDVTLRTSDEHSILDESSSRRLNIAANIRIGSHVWLGDKVTVGKGCSIADGVVVGAHSLVIKDLEQRNSVYAGTPAKLIRKNIKWRRELVS
ncbi:MULTISPECIES: acyltransferase [Sinorhizobium]|uniref:acyltransferase n=1 Tax=Sinorhizobium TaxID=28105 RepID=UPI000BE8E9B5|nr:MULTISPECIES: acyltransferase [Sinorhizobium]PDT55019.1 hypothetical protein CO664_08075 [Sinorhizobium sp. NG07B]POH32061.1 hypothetical protein ATY30_11715 [Sinorhizobium americanum]